MVHMPPESEWRLAVKHRAGSLEAAVANARLRNLGISFGILLLLGISVLTMVVTTHRAQRLASQQMAFVAGVSHELRTPLAVIRSAGENLADGLIEDATQSRKYGTIIRNEGRRLSEMVERILDFAGIQAQRRNYELRPVEVTDLVKATLDDNAALLDSGMFEVATSLPPESMKILADPAALKSALQNLVSNAVKYSNGSKWIGLTVQRHGDSVEIRVQDRGIGIPSSDLPHIFEPFYRGREVMDAQIQGSGLGLSLVKHVVEGHKGTIAVDSSHRRGTTFTLRLPVMCD
jgi:signal transduction histidine kinase